MTRTVHCTYLMLWRRPPKLTPRAFLSYLRECATSFPACLPTVRSDSNISIPYTGSVQVCFFHQIFLSSCIFFLGGQQMSKFSEIEGFRPIPQTARCGVWQCLISPRWHSGKSPGGLQITTRHFSAMNCI